MNKFIFAFLIILPVCGYSQKFSTRKLFTEFVKREVTQPCSFSNDLHFFQSKKLKVGSKSQNYILKNFKYTDFEITIECVFTIGENDCFSHQIFLFSKNKRKKIDSLMVDYLGDSEAYISIESLVNISPEGISVELSDKESSVINSKTYSSKKLIFRLNKDGIFTLMNKEPIFSIAGRFYTLKEYNQEFINSKSIELKKISNNSMTDTLLLLKSDKSITIFQNNKSNLFTRITSLENKKNLNLQDFDSYDNGLIINKREGKDLKSYYFKFDGKDFNFDKELINGKEGRNAKDKSIRKIWDY